MASTSRGFPRVTLALLLTVPLLGVTGFQSSPREGPGPGASAGGQELRSGPITTVTAEIIETDTLAGRVILVNAWATWCGPCVLEMPGLQRVQDDYGDQGFLVLGISADDKGPEFVRAFLEDLKITYPVTVGPQRPLGRLAAQVRGLPTSFLLGRDGHLAQKVEGVFPEEALRTAVEKLLREELPRENPPR